MIDFKNKVAVITGAGRGIGRGIAMRCAKEGMKIVLAGIGMESLNKTSAELETMGVETLTVQTDVSLLADVENLANRTYEHFGKVDLLVNNAGVYSPGSVLDLSMDDWQWVMGVNFYGILHGIRSFVPRMIAQDSDCHIVNVASISGLLPGGGSYGVSKHAAVVLSESLFSELALKSKKVKVSVYCPGWVDTEFDTIERSRPQRYNKSKIELSDKYRENWKESLTSGFSTEETADVLFEGLQKDLLYIGIKAFMRQNPDYPKQIQMRAENMIDEKNP